MLATRDFVGYGRNPPKVEWPENALLAVNVVVNYEEGAELCIEFGDPACNHLGLDHYGPGRPAADQQARDLYVENQFEYGSSTGLHRLLGIFDKYGTKATFFCCGRALESNPAAAKAISERGHEIGSHGYRWVLQRTLTREEERQGLHRTVDVIRNLTGTRPVGQLTWGVSLNTRELLAEEGGFLYDSDTIADDLPYFAEVQGKKWLLVPYTATADDYRYVEPAGFVEPDEFFKELKATFDQLYKESARVPKMMSIGLRPRISGLPARANAVEKFIRYAKSHARVWFARRDEIARVWLDQFAS
jgi:peptidoglycan/xylan/chitin deacetylase (PgdA/CDA1 family)